MQASRYSAEECKDIHGAEYVEYLKRINPRDNGRLARLLSLADVRPEHVVLDVGCGHALLLDLLNGRVARYYGVDFSPPFIEAALSRHSPLPSNASFHCESVVDFCARHPREIDRVFLFDFTEHVQDDDLLPILRALHGVLKDNGRLCVHTPNLGFFLERLKARNIILQQHPAHIAVRDLAEYEQLFAAAGFTDVRGRYVPHYLRELAWLHALRGIPGLGKFFEARIFMDCRR